ASWPTASTAGRRRNSRRTWGLAPAGQPKARRSWPLKAASPRSVAMLAGIDSFTWTRDPAYPWSLPGIGLPALAAVTLILVVLTVWTYLGVPGATVRRVLLVLGLRL